MLHFNLDVTLYEGSEYIQIYGFGKTNETEWDAYNSVFMDALIYDRQYLYDTGNVSVKQKFDVSVIQEGEFVRIMMDRILLKEDVDKSLEKRNTGFEL